MMVLLVHRWQEGRVEEEVRLGIKKRLLIQFDETSLMRENVTLNLLIFHLVAVPSFTALNFMSSLKSFKEKILYFFIKKF